TGVGLPCRLYKPASGPFVLKAGVQELRAALQVRPTSSPNFQCARELFRNCEIKRKVYREQGVVTGPSRPQYQMSSKKGALTPAWALVGSWAGITRTLSPRLLYPG